MHGGTEAVFSYNKNDQLVSTDIHRVDMKK